MRFDVRAHFGRAAARVGGGRVNLPDRFHLRVRTTPSKVEQRSANARARLLALGLAQVALAVLLVGADRISTLYAFRKQGTHRGLAAPYRVLTFGSVRQAAPWRRGSHVMFERSGLIVLSR